jgi:hypothetical protein
MSFLGVKRAVRFRDNPTAGSHQNALQPVIILDEALGRRIIPVIYTTQQAAGYSFKINGSGKIAMRSIEITSKRDSSSQP